MSELATDRYWQNWDAAGVAPAIDSYWLASELEQKNRRDLTADLLAVFGEDVPMFEVGCGTGLMADEMIQAGITRPEGYVGGDVSPAMLAIAQKRYPALKWRPADIFDLAGESHDNVINLHVLQHLPRYEEALEQLVAAARGRLYIATRFVEEQDDEIGMSTELTAFGARQFHTNRYSLARMTEALASLTGRPVDVRKINADVYALVVDLR